MSEKLRPGIRALDRLMKSNPALSVARMTPEQLTKVQTTVIPDGGPAALVLGRTRKGVDVRTTSFAARDGDLPLRIYTPEGWSRSPRPVVLNFHGGGFVLGSARQGDWICSTVAADLDAVVVSVDYRLAPAHKFPAALDDCYDALLWTAAHAADLGADPARLAVMGDSAGGNLAAVVSLVARDEHGPTIRHQTLIYPATDMTDDALEDASFAANTRGIVLSNDDIEVFRDHYLGDGADRADGRLSPIRADLSDLPPAVVVVAGLDPLHDSGVRYAQALADAGTDVRVEDFHQMPHGFLSFPYFAHAARPAMAAIIASQRAALA
jgi:acetyl esterase